MYTIQTTALHEGEYDAVHSRFALKAHWHNAKMDTGADQERATVSVEAGWQAAADQTGGCHNMAKRYAIEKEGWALGRRGDKAVAVKIADDDSGIARGQYRSLGVPYKPLTGSRAVFEAFVAALSRVHAGGNPTIGAVCRAYEQWLEDEGKAVRGFRDRVPRLMRHFENVNVLDMSEALCRQYAKDNAGMYAAWTIWGDLNGLRSALRWAYAKQRMFESPVFERMWNIAQPESRKRVLTPDEYWRMIDAARKDQPPHVELFLWLLLLTAQRHSTIIRLRWDMIDFEARVIRFTAMHKTRTSILDRGHEKARADVVYGDTLAGVLQTAYARRRTDYVLEYRGSPIKRLLTNAFNRVRAEAGLGTDVTPHVFRHTAATWARESGLSAEQVARMTGHKDERVLNEVYTHLTAKASQPAVAAVEQRVGNRLRIVK